MNRLPSKANTPARMRSAPPGSLNGDAYPAPVASADQTRTLPASDVALRLKLLRFPAIRERTGLSRTTIWRLERRGDFPKHRRISTNAVAWVEEEVLSWIRSRIGDVAV